QSVTLADVGERHGYLVELERAVDVDADVAGDAQVGERLKLGRTLSHGEDADPASGDPAGDPADRHDAQQRADRPADAAILAAGGERSPVRQHRPVGDEVED